jgi:hypothetical protein
MENGRYFIHPIIVNITYSIYNNTMSKSKHKKYKQIESSKKSISDQQIGESVGSTDPSTDSKRINETVSYPIIPLIPIRNKKSKDRDPSIYLIEYEQNITELDHMDESNLSSTNLGQIFRNIFNPVFRIIKMYEELIWQIYLSVN